MIKVARFLLVAIAVLAAVAGCRKEQQEPGEVDTFSFVVYPGARYLAQLTELTKQAHKTITPNDPEPPPTAIYDVEAPIEEVADFYARSYGYGAVAPDATNNLSAAKPQAYYRAGELGADVRAIEDLLKTMDLKTDVSKAAGAYKSAEISPRPNRPRVTIQRPYFDITTSEVVDRTLILMSR
jgi:hypothetical protein